MEKVLFNHNCASLTMAFGIPQPRAKVLIEKFEARAMKLLKEEHCCMSEVLEYLCNDLAQKENERLFLCFAWGARQQAIQQIDGFMGFLKLLDSLREEGPDMGELPDEGPDG